MLALLLSQCFEIEDMGGLSSMRRSVALIPASTVEFYWAAIGARDRFLAERDYKQLHLYD